MVLHRRLEGILGLTVRRWLRLHLLEQRAGRPVRQQVAGLPALVVRLRAGTEAQNTPGVTVVLLAGTLEAVVALAVTWATVLQAARVARPQTAAAAALLVADQQAVTVAQRMAALAATTTTEPMAAGTTR